MVVAEQVVGEEVFHELCVDGSVEDFCDERNDGDGAVVGR